MGCRLSYYDRALKDCPDDMYSQCTRVKNGFIVSEVKDMSDEHFTQHQKMLLRESWDILSVKQHEHGVAIFIRIFATRPETKQLFPFKDLEGEELLKNPLFCSHSKRFMHAIETTIHHLDALDLVLVPVLHRLGERHVRISGFKIEYLSVFIRSMLDVFAEALGRKRFTKEVYATWLHLGHFIANRMNEGFQIGLANLPKCQQPCHSDENSTVITVHNAHSDSG